MEPCTSSSAWSCPRDSLRPDLTSDLRVGVKPASEERVLGRRHRLRVRTTVGPRDGTVTQKNELPRAAANLDAIAGKARIVLLPAAPAVLEPRPKREVIFPRRVPHSVALLLALPFNDLHFGAVAQRPRQVKRADAEAKSHDGKEGSNQHRSLRSNVPCTRNSPTSFPRGLDHSANSDSDSGRSTGTTDPEQKFAALRRAQSNDQATAHRTQW